MKPEQRHAARLVLLKAWRNFGHNAFGVDWRGQHWASLHDAEALGWCTFIADRCRLTTAGVDELAPWRGKPEAAE
jgi:hypothetical protein